jgi:hypothetical protein
MIGIISAVVGLLTSAILHMEEQKKNWKEIYK